MGVYFLSFSIFLSMYKRMTTVIWLALSRAAAFGQLHRNLKEYLQYVVVRSS